MITILLVALAIPAAGEILSTEFRKDAAPNDYIEKARAFGDCMIEYGRDRYGKVHSPLFSNILTREAEPKTTPYPLFAEKQNNKTPSPFMLFDFNKILNYPDGMNGAGPHKVTLYGCDPWEDRELYATLHEISRVTGDPKYKHAADEALNWWFENTQSAETGLYPWGEHLGWDLEHDCPTYFDGPSKYLYAACYHEIKDAVPFLDYLIALPAKAPFSRTPLERYALGIWNSHFWDKEKAYFDRHGDYTGQDDRKGNKNGFPAHLGAYMEVWTSAYLNSKNAEFKRQIENAFHKTLDMAVARTEKYGFFPFDFDPELNGKEPRFSDQAYRLALHTAALAEEIETANPAVAQKMRKLADLHLKDKEKPSAKAAVKKPVPLLRDLSGSNTPGGYAGMIFQNVDYYDQFGDGEFLQVAETYARQACERFLDDQCPLPKARAGIQRTAQAGPFPDYYFHGSELIRAFALLGEAIEKHRGK